MKYETGFNKILLAMGICLMMGALFVRNASSQTIEAVISTPPHPQSIAISPDGTRAYVGHVNSQSHNSSQLTVIDLTTNTLLSPVTVTGANTHGVAFSPDGSTVLATTSTVSGINYIDAVSSVPSAFYNMANPYGLTLTRDGSLAFLPTSANTVEIVDVAGQVQAGVIGTQFNPSSVKLSPDETTAYITIFTDNALQVADVSSETIVSTLSGLFYPVEIEISPDGTTGYIANEQSVLVVDLTVSPPSPGPIIPAPTTSELTVQPIELTPNGSKLLAVGGFDLLTIVDTATNAIDAQITVLPEPVAVKVSPCGTRVYVVNRDSDAVTVIDISDLTQSAIHHWPGDGDPQDAVGTAHGSHPSGAFGAGEVGDAFQFDGMNRFEVGPFNYSGPFTVSFWVKATTVNQPEWTGILSSSGSPAGPASFQIDFGPSNDYRVHLTDGNFVVPIGPASTDFQHVAVTFDGSTVSTFLNGSLQSSSTATTMDFTLLKLGENRNGDRPFEGLVDEVQFHVEALTEECIQALCPISPTSGGVATGIESTTWGQIKKQQY